MTTSLKARRAWRMTSCSRERVHQRAFTDSCFGCSQKGHETRECSEIHAGLPNTAVQDEERVKPPLDRRYIIGSGQSTATQPQVKARFDSSILANPVVINCLVDTGAGVSILPSSMSAKSEECQALSPSFYLQTRLMASPSKLRVRSNYW